MTFDAFTAKRSTIEEVQEAIDKAFRDESLEELVRLSEELGLYDITDNPLKKE